MSIGERLHYEASPAPILYHPTLRRIPADFERWFAIEPD